MRRRNPVERFWSRIDQSGGPEACWEWQGAHDPNGYGTVSGWFMGEGRRPLRTHRVAFLLTHGEIAEGLFVCHKCDNPPCCNPPHLFLGTCADNIHDAAVKGRLARKLSPDIIARARELIETTPLVAVAHEFGVSHVAVNHALSGRSWAHLNQPCRTRRQVTRERADDIRREYRETLITYSGLVAKYGVDVALVSRIIRNVIHHDPSYVPPLGRKAQSK